MVHNPAAMPDPPAAHYTPEEAEEILRRALQRQSEVGLSRDDLIAAAREVGVSESALVSAAEEVERGRVEREVVVRLTAEKRAGFVRHVGAYAMTSVALFLLNLLTNMVTVTDQVPRWWSLFPLVIWGIAVGVHAARALGNREPAADDVQREVARASEEARERARRSERPPGAEEMLSRLGDLLQPAPRATESEERVRVAPTGEAEAPAEASTEPAEGDAQERREG